MARHLFRRGAILALAGAAALTGCRGPWGPGAAAPPSSAAASESGAPPAAGLGIARGQVPFELVWAFEKA